MGGRAYLAYRPEGRIRNMFGQYVPDQNIEEGDLPERPEDFQPMVGTYRDVSERAVFLNEVQMRSGFLYYLFWAEMEESPDRPKPRCVFCGHPARNEETGQCQGCDRISADEEWYV